VYHALAVALRRRGLDVLTTHEAGRNGSTDEEQPRFAITQLRCLVTFNRGDFAQLHSQTLERGDHHFGIVVSRQSAIGVVVRQLAALTSARSVDDLRDQLIWLS
jgi:hypothetical protein